MKTKSIHSLFTPLTYYVMKTTLEYLQSIASESSDIICVAKLRGRKADPKEASQIVRERIKHRISVVEDVLNELHNCCKALDHTEISCAIVNAIADRIVNDAFTKLIWNIKEREGE